jgi:hypothetical protein
MNKTIKSGKANADWDKVQQEVTLSEITLGHAIAP